MVEQRDRLDQMLLAAKLITEEQLKMALDFQKAVGGKLGAIIVKLGFIEDLTLTNFIAQQQGMRVVNLDELILPEILVKRIPKKLIRRHHVLPISYKDGVLTVVTSDPYDYEATEELQLAQDAKIDLQLAPRSQILKYINSLLAADERSSPTKEKSRAELLKETVARLRLDSERGAKPHLLEAVTALLIEKGIFSEEELLRKVKPGEGADKEKP